MTKDTEVKIEDATGGATGGNTQNTQPPPPPPPPPPPAISAAEQQRQQAENERQRELDAIERQRQLVIQNQEILNRMQARQRQNAPPPPAVQNAPPPPTGQNHQPVVGENNNSLVSRDIASGGFDGIGVVPNRAGAAPNAGPAQQFQAFLPQQLQNMAASLPNFTGRDPTLLRAWVEAIDMARSEFNLDDRQAATLAQYCFPESSDVKAWHILEKKKGRIVNLHLWGAAAGLREALQNKYGVASNLTLITQKMSKRMFQTTGQTTNHFKDLLDDVLNDYIKFAFPNIVPNSPEFWDTHERLLLLHMRNGLHPELKSKLKDLDDFTTSDALTKAATNLEVELGKAGGMKYKNQAPPMSGTPSHPIVVAGVQSQSQPANPQAPPTAQAAAASRREDITCTYCGIYGHSRENCRTRRDDNKKLKPGEKERDQCEGYPKKTYGQRQKEARQKKREAKEREAAAAAATTMTQQGAAVGAVSTTPAPQQSWVFTGTHWVPTVPQEVSRRGHFSGYEPPIPVYQSYQPPPPNPDLRFDDYLSPQGQAPGQ